MSDDNVQPRTVDASPTKDFFIRMLVKDISLSKAIVDLVDNSIDGALRVRGASGSLEGLWVNLEVSEAGEFLRISDNCGGIPLDTAIRYAFRFGRPQDAGGPLGMIGQFGVGMKRAFFKLGNHFKVISKTATVQFVVEEDVGAWREREKWDFPLSIQGEETLAPEECGTTVEVTELHETVAEQFRLETFRQSLRSILRSAHRVSLERGLRVNFNGTPVDFEPSELLVSDDIAPAISTLELYDGRVRVKVVAGVAASDPQRAGWNIYCNGRLVLEADKSEISGWGDTVPRFHGQYNRFRGYVFFNSDEGQLLPWNTTKSGVDTDSPAYRHVRLRMISTMRPIIDFLNRLDKETQTEEDERYLHQIVESARPVRVSELPTEKTQFFHFAEAPSRISRPEMKRIVYEKPTPQVERVKDALGVRTLREVGEKTFEYFLHHECEEP